jgi:hypothetical protein
MGPFETALAALAALDVTGVAASFDVATVPDEVNRGQLPALLALPVRAPDEGPRLFGEQSGGFEAVAFADGVRTVTYTVTHLLLVAPEAAGSGLRSHLPGLVALIDAYFAALAADVTLGGALLRPARVRVEPGLFDHGEARYIGCAFRHTWVVQL